MAARKHQHLFPAIGGGIRSVTVSWASVIIPTHRRKSVPGSEKVLPADGAVDVEKVLHASVVILK